jgi:hypothetical protein
LEVQTKEWFDAYNLYNEISLAGKTKSSNFWYDSNELLRSVTGYLHIDLDKFLKEWSNRCLTNKLKIMGYHCTRQNNKDIFYSKGILPLSDEVIGIFLSTVVSEFQMPSITERQIDEIVQSITEDSLWKYRSGIGVGPYLFLSYTDSKKPDNDFNNNGSEITWLFIDYFLKYCRLHSIDPGFPDRFTFREAISQKLIPFIIHCEIPFSMICHKDYLTFCILRAFFNFIDPEDISIFEGCSIDMRGKTLEPKYIVLIEQL